MQGNIQRAIDQTRLRDGESTFQRQGVSWNRQHPSSFPTSFVSVFLKITSQKYRVNHQSHSSHSLHAMPGHFNPKSRLLSGEIVLFSTWLWG